MAFPKILRIKSISCYMQDGNYQISAEEWAEYRKKEIALEEECNLIKKLLRKGYSAKVCRKYLHRRNDCHETVTSLVVFSQRGNNEPDDVTHWD